MQIKVDRFTWAVIAVVVLLLAAAVFTVNRSDPQADEPSYLDPAQPEAPVHNAFVALESGNVSKAREQYSRRILDEISEQPGFDPFYRGGSDSNTTRRLRIVEVKMNPDDPDRASVDFTQDTYNSEGLLGGSTWTRRGVVEVVREEGAWKLDSQEFFY